MSEARGDAALLELLALLERRGYDFVTPLNATLRTVRARPRNATARDVRGVLGWSLPFEAGAVDDEIEGLLLQAGALSEGDMRYRCRYRISRVEGALFLHSAFPAHGPDAVFLGPDSYRFASFLVTELRNGAPVRRLWDIGTGPGVGAVVAARLTGAATVRMSDVNDQALRLARLNATHAGVTAQGVRSDGLDACEEEQDLIVANPPFIAAGPDVYSDGGGSLGAEVSLAWAEAASTRLAPGGRLLMYTGAAIVDGQDGLRERLAALAVERRLQLHYRELDPDIFGSELNRPQYADVERIAAVGIVMARP